MLKKLPIMLFSNVAYYATPPLQPLVPLLLEKSLVSAVEGLLGVETAPNLVI